MSIRANSDHEEAAEEGGVELVLTAVTYTGDRSMYNSDGLRTQGGYPALDGFQGGETKLVKLPSNSLGWWERHAAFEVDYSEQGIASTMLGRNYLPEQIAGPGYDPQLRDELCDALNLDRVPGTQDEWVDALQDAAGTDEEPTSANEDPTDNRVDELVADVNRSVLIQVTNSYEDGVDEFLEEVDKSSVSHLKATEAAGFLADREDQQAVDRRIEKAETGQEP